MSNVTPPAGAGPDRLTVNANTDVPALPSTSVTSPIVKPTPASSFRFSRTAVVSYVDPDDYGCVFMSHALSAQALLDIVVESDLIGMSRTRAHR